MVASGIRRESDSGLHDQVMGGLILRHPAGLLGPDPDLHHPAPAAADPGMTRAYPARPGPVHAGIPDASRRPADSAWSRAGAMAGLGALAVGSGLAGAFAGLLPGGGWYAVECDEPVAKLDQY